MKQRILKKLNSIFDFMQGNVLTLTVSTILMNLATSLGWPYFSLYVSALGGSPVIVGLVFSVGVLAGLPTFPIGGYIADYKGRVRIVGVMTCVEALMFSFFIFAKNWLMMILGLFLWQLVCIHYAIISAITADSLPPNKRGVGFAITTALPRVAGFIAPYISGYLIDLYGGGSVGVKTAMPICWTVSLILGLIAGMIRLKFLKETLKKSDSSIRREEFSSLIKDSYKSVLESLKWMSKPLWAIAAISATITFFISIAGPFWVIYATNVINIKATSWGFLILILGIIQTSLLIPMGYLIDRFGAKRLILIALSIAIIPALLFTFCKSLLEVFVVLLLLTVVNAILVPASLSLKANLIPRERRGRLLSILGQGISITWSSVWAMGLILFIPMAAGMLLGGYVYESNSKSPWLILVVAIIFCLVLAIRFIKEPEKPEI